MALPTCVKCGSTLFETKEVTPRGSNFKLNFVQCSSCGGVVGVLDFYNIGGMLQTLAKKLGAGNIG
jgi:predicted nucleic-acid-binding Zn-ribbon protein